MSVITIYVDSKHHYNNYQLEEWRKQFVGKYCIVRSKEEGINSGYIVSFNQLTVIMRDVRKNLYYRKIDKPLSWYERCAVLGVAQNSRLSAPVSKKLIFKDYSLTSCNEISTKSFISYPIYTKH